MMPLVDTTIRVSVVVGLGLLAVATFRGRSAALRHWLLAAALCCAAVVPLVGPFAPTWGVPLAFTGTASPSGSAAIDALGPPVVAADPLAGATPTALLTSGHGRPGTTLTGIVWMAGTVGGVALLLIGLSRLLWLTSRSVALADGPWSAAAIDLARHVGIRRRVRLLQSDHPTLLVTWGLVYPAIILPRGAADWTADRIRVVLTHELAHIRRADWAVQIAAELLRAVFWFNPILWVATRRLRDESEQACDDAVLRQGVEGTDYAVELLALARVLTARRPPWCPAPAMARPSSLERRVAAMLNNRVNRRPLSSSVRFASALMLAALAIGVAGFSASAQTFVSFSGSVVDQFGGSLGGATVAVTNAQNGQKYEVRSNPIGVFEFVGLMTGEYELRAARPGFSPLTEHVAINGRNPRSILKLAVGSLEETITVVDRTASVGSAPRPSPEAAVRKPAEACVPPAEGGMLKPPTKITDARPVYPKGSGAERLAGKLEFEALIGEDGTIKDVRPVDDHAQADLAQAAMDAVRRWRYTPTLLNCVPIEVSMRVHVMFRAD